MYVHEPVPGHFHSTMITGTGQAVARAAVLWGSQLQHWQVGMWGCKDRNCLKMGPGHNFSRYTSWRKWSLCQPALKDLTVHLQLQIFLGSGSWSTQESCSEIQAMSPFDMFLARLIFFWKTKTNQMTFSPPASSIFPVWLCSEHFGHKCSYFAHPAADLSFSKSPIFSRGWNMSMDKHKPSDSPEQEDLWGPAQQSPVGSVRSVRHIWWAHGAPRAWRVSAGWRGRLSTAACTTLGPAGAGESSGQSHHFIPYSLLCPWLSWSFWGKYQIKPYWKQTTTNLRLQVLIRLFFCSCSFTCNIPGSRENLEAGNTHRIALLMGDPLWSGGRSLIVSLLEAERWGGLGCHDPGRSQQGPSGSWWMSLESGSASAQDFPAWLKLGQQGSHSRESLWDTCSGNGYTSALYVKLHGKKSQPWSGFCLTRSISQYHSLSFESRKSRQSFQVCPSCYPS